jgi:transposase-like protein
MGLLNRHGVDNHSTVQAQVVPDTKQQTLSPTVHSHVAPGSTVYTDAHSGYTGLDRDFIHEVIDHAEAYVRGKVHTDGIENFWSLLKRAITGTYVNVEPFHLFRYLDEDSFRFNTRKTTGGARFTKVTSTITDKRLTYKELTGAATTPA